MPKYYCDFVVSILQVAFVISARYVIVTQLT